MKTKKQIIEETAEFYNSGNRAEHFPTYGERRCSYFFQGKMCALGRCLINPEKIEEDSQRKFTVGELGDTAAKSILGHFGTDIFKPEYRGHEPGFWKDLQNFHDSVQHWGIDGINSRGEDFKLNLLEKWG